MLHIVTLLVFGLVFLPEITNGNNSTKLDTNYRYRNGAFITKIDHVLPGNTIASLFLPSMISCNQKCLVHSTCVSFNYQLNSDGRALGVCELKNRGVTDGGDSTRSLQYKPGYVFTQIYAGIYMPASCLDHARNGAVRSGLYSIYDNSGTEYQVYCDLTSESGMAWTLVMSQSYKNLAMPQIRLPLFTDSPLNQESPQWDAYRLSLNRMNGLKIVSSHWRVTCNFPTEGLQYRDYVRANFAEFDAITFDGSASCRKVEYLNVRGHECRGCTAAWWQHTLNSYFLHHDSSWNACEFGSTAGYTASEDNFGFYWLGNRNVAFRCTSTNTSSTNHWIGGHL